MQEFDPRQKAAVRLAPSAFIALTGLGVVIVALQALPHPASNNTAVPGLSPAALAAPKQQQAFAQAQLNTPINVMIKVLPGETLEAAVRRTGVGKDEARQAVQMLGQAFDTANIKAGLALQANLTRPRTQQAEPKLLALTVRPDPITAVSLSRARNGALQVKKLEEKVLEQTAVASGEVTDSLYVAAQKAGATPELTAQVVKLFAHKLDFTRDIQPGDHFSMVFDRKVTESGRQLGAGDLLFAEIRAKGGVTRFYRFKTPAMNSAEFFDDFGKSIRSLLLRTPLDNVRITSSFGMRMHPILGFTKMHTGIDFGAPMGTPVYAAGDGVVEKAEWSNGYGRWLQIKHPGGIETGYGHLSRWAVKSGQHVHQGQVVAYVGSSGRSTGPHLHYETIINGRKINPSNFKPRSGVELAGKQLVDFKFEKARIDGLLSQKVAQSGPAKARG